MAALVVYGNRNQQSGHNLCPDNEPGTLDDRSYVAVQSLLVQGTSGGLRVIFVVCDVLVMHLHAIIPLQADLTSMYVCSSQKQTVHDRVQRLVLMQRQNFLRRRT